MDNFNKLIQRSYAATKKRGLIDENTDIFDFEDKIYEEYLEIVETKTLDDMAREVVDLIAVCMNFLTNYGFDVEKEFEKCVLHQETRKD